MLMNGVCSLIACWICGHCCARASSSVVATNVRTISVMFVSFQKEKKPLSPLLGSATNCAYSSGTGRSLVNCEYGNTMS